jgi:hypothetical protein
MKFAVESIEAMIYTIRGHRVMLDSDLAKLYGVETKVLNQAVKRNLKRFPNDFMIQLNSEEYRFLKSQIVTSKTGSGGKQKLPFVFTENGVAMLSGILNSDRAINVNIAIMRTFTKLRSFLAMESSLKSDVDQLKKNTNHLFKIVFERLDDLEEGLPEHPKDRKRIGLKGTTKA